MKCHNCSGFFWSSTFQNIVIWMIQTFQNFSTFWDVRRKILRAMPIKNEWNWLILGQSTSIQTGFQHLLILQSYLRNHFVDNEQTQYVSWTSFPYSATRLKPFLAPRPHPSCYSGLAIPAPYAFINGFVDPFFFCFLCQAVADNIICA